MWARPQRGSCVTNAKTGPETNHVTLFIAHPRCVKPQPIASTGSREHGGSKDSKPGVHQSQSHPIHSRKQPDAVLHIEILYGVPRVRYDVQIN